MIPLWTAAAAAAATGGTATGGWQATGVSIDSRTVQPGDLFVAIKGPNFDGHRFVEDALDGGAVAAMVSEKPAGMDASAPLLTVDGSGPRGPRAFCGNGNDRFRRGEPRPGQHIPATAMTPHLRETRRS